MSLRLDGELSELEAALLLAHLKRCDACSAFSADLEAVALQLRAAPFERLEEPIALPVVRRGSSLRAMQVGAAAVLVAAAAGLGMLLGTLGSHPSPPAGKAATRTLSGFHDSLAFAIDERPRGLLLYPLRDYIPRKGLVLGTSEV